MEKDKVEKWLEILNFWTNAIEEYTERYPDSKKKAEEYSDLIDELYEIYQYLQI